MGKKGFFLKNILLAICLASCASQRAVREEPRADPLAQTAETVKKNGGTKYFILDENKDPIVKADFPGGFEAIYDLKRAEPDGENGFAVPFSVRSEDAVWYDWLYWTIPEDAAGILLAFDDNYQEVWERYFGLLDKYGARATFFVQGRYCEFCPLALSRGFDIGYHTLNHLNLPKVSREVFLEECLSEVPEFRQAGVPLTAFAYPFGLSEPWMHEELWGTFTLLRGYGVTFRVYEKKDIQEGYISSKAIDNILFKKDDDFKKMIDLILLSLKFLGGDRILPLTTHTVSDDADWGIKPQRLEYLLRTANALKLAFYRYQDVR
ncbi:MAG: polysaccharide deacetylase family protein [Spirochaetaceae bacterium]|jgi:peptidoglycan/xylan/chitin deacetylase (PgdA/CDA1 family)|nr:polysaccharide deacetylase family protein [Spirochaetaceae bacterium]